MRCSCALKKEHLGTVPEIDAPLSGRKRATSASKPRLYKTASDNAMTHFANGHHKPVHKHNDSAHKSGLPYKIPIPHSVQGNSDVARRSTDSLPNLKKEPLTQLHSENPRLVRSERGSPEPRSFPFLDDKSALPRLDMAYQFPDDYVSSPQAQETFYDLPDESPLVSSGLNATVDWSDLSLPLNNATYSTGFSQPLAYTSLDNTSGPQCLATPSSGSGSDAASDYMSHHANHGSPFRPDLSVASNTDARSINRLSSASFVSIPQTSQATKPDAEFHPTTASPTEFEEPSALHADAFERHGITVHDVQRLAHPDTPTEAMSSLSLPTRTDDMNPRLWSDPSLDPYIPQEIIDPGDISGWR